MGDNMVTVPDGEYRKLLESAIRIEIFSDFVNRSKYGIDREKCGMYLGFEVKNARED